MLEWNLLILGHHRAGYRVGPANSNRQEARNMKAKTFNHWTILLLIFPITGSFAAVRGADTAARKAVPTGTLTKHTFSQSEIFPGTTRDYWVYVPSQYDGSKPTCVHVEQDGLQFNMPVVF